ncbi:MAG: hypothetical protein AB1306_09115 [Nitrospirota bacterium]
MDYREKAFKEKFKNASAHLGVAPNQIISLKFRETVNSYSEYHNLLDILQREANITHQKLADNFQGTGYILSDSNSKIILVEHETGLEILYIAGSIASLIGLVHLVSQYWSSMRNHFDLRHHRNFRDIEIRKLDNNGHIKEDRFDGHGIPGMPLLPNSIIISATQNLENEIKDLKQEIKKLSNRIKDIETPSKREKEETTIKSKKIKRTKNIKK